MGKRIEMDAPHDATPTRDESGRYLPRHRGIVAVKNDPNFDRAQWVKDFTAALDESMMANWDSVAKLMLTSPELTVHAFQQLCWWGLVRKSVKILAKGGVHGRVIHHPDGAWVVESIGWVRK